MDGVFGNRVWERSPVAGKEVNVGVAVFPIIFTIFDHFYISITKVLPTQFKCVGQLHVYA